jgi:hypothetical protein
MQQLVVGDASCTLRNGNFLQWFVLCCDVQEIPCSFGNPAFGSVWTTSRYQHAVL